MLSLLFFVLFASESASAFRVQPNFYISDLRRLVEEQTRLPPICREDSIQANHTATEGDCICDGEADNNFAGMFCAEWNRRPAWCYCTGDCERGEGGRCFECQSLPNALDVSDTCQAQFDLESHQFIGTTFSAWYEQNQLCLIQGITSIQYLDVFGHIALECQGGYEEQLKQCFGRGWALVNFSFNGRASNCYTDMFIGTVEAQMQTCLPDLCVGEYEKFIPDLEAFGRSLLGQYTGFRWQIQAQVFAVTATPEERLDPINERIDDLELLINKAIQQIDVIRNALELEDTCKFTKYRSCCGDGDCFEDTSATFRLSPDISDWDCYDCLVRCQLYYNVCCFYNAATKQCYLNRFRVSNVSPNEDHWAVVLLKDDPEDISLPPIPESA